MLPLKWSLHGTFILSLQVHLLICLFYFPVICFKLPITQTAVACMAGGIRLICFSAWSLIKIRSKSDSKLIRNVTGGIFPHSFPLALYQEGTQCTTIPSATQTRTADNSNFCQFPLNRVIESQLYLCSTACMPCKLLFFVKLTKHWITLTPIQRNLKPNWLSFKLFSLEMCIFLLGEGITPEVPTHVGDHKLRQTLIQRCDHLSDEVIKWRNHKIKWITH